jgi:hypothetical protein
MTEYLFLQEEHLFALLVGCMIAPQKVQNPMDQQSL